MSPTQVARRLDMQRRPGYAVASGDLFDTVWTAAYRAGRDDIVQDAYAAYCTGTDLRPMLAGALGFVLGAALIAFGWWIS